MMHILLNHYYNKLHLYFVLAEPTISHQDFAIINCKLPTNKNQIILPAESQLLPSFTPTFPLTVPPVPNRCSFASYDR